MNRRSIRNPENAGSEYSADTEAESNAITGGKQYTLTITFIGSHVNYTLTDFDPYQNDVPWRQERAGAFGLKVAPGTKLKITKLRIKELR